MKNKSCFLVGYNRMLNLLYVSIGHIALSTFLFSCTPSPVKNPLLLSADSLMEAQPDSALSILESVPSPEKLSGVDRAFYALLMTQARHKNFLPLKDDSLIKIAVDYYGDKKKSMNAAKAHYYWGATYRDRGRICFAVDEYLTAIRLMSEKNEFLAMIYNNLGECYEDNGLYEVAMEAYRNAYDMLKGGNEQIYSLRGIARVFLLRNENDSALCYYHKALDFALADQNSGLIGILYHDLAMAYNEKSDYLQADHYVSKAIKTVNREKVATAYLLKAQIMLNSNHIDSAFYYYNKNVSRLDICEQAVFYDGMCQIAMKRGDWKAAMENKEAYMKLYDSIQIMDNNKELARLIDKHQLDEHKRLISEHAKMVIFTVCLLFLMLIIALVFWALLMDRKRKRRIINLQQELNQKRVDVTLLREEESSDSPDEIDRRKIELLKRQVQLCKLMFQSTECFRVLETMNKSSQRQLLNMDHLRAEMKDSIWKSFVDVMNSLNEGGVKLTPEDRYFCVLILLNCSKPVIMELMDVTSDALKTRKNRIKNKMSPQLFKFVFESDNQHTMKK